MAGRAIYYDTETTGVRAKEDRIVEIAAYDVQRELEFHRMVNPGVSIPKEAAAIHGISDEMVAEAPTFAQVAVEFVEFCEGDVFLIAHNNDAFDQLFLEAEYARHEVEIPDWRFIDTLKWSRRYRPDLPRHALQFLREAYGIVANNAHRALDDVIVLHQVFSQMIDNLPLESVYELISKPQIVQRMPFGKHRGKLLNDLPRDYIKWLHESGALDKRENSDLKASLEKLG